MIYIKKLLWPFVTFWVLDSILLYVGSLLYPFYFVLGNKNLSVIWAAVVAGLVWTFLVWASDPIIGDKFKTKSKLIKFGFYFLANFFGLWITARFASTFGFGATSFVWLVFLALLANIFQYGLWKTGKFKKTIR
ncbi:MAG TPA: hypothetical protein VJ227_04760 [Patescibacteria group bacterium]|nr:hypothetical protein [Patescibacteria group bacterium]